MPMSSSSDNPLNMTNDPFDGKSFVLPETGCTTERAQFFKRMNEIHALLYTTKLSFDVCNKEYNKIIPNLTSKENTPMKLAINGGNYIAMPASRLVALLKDGLNIHTRQAFIMFYGSFVTYLYDLFARSFDSQGFKENIIDKSRDILMLKKWDGKFCKMNEVFDIGYKANDLISRFNKFDMTYHDKKYKNPLHFLDELAQVRHRIVHASSILETGKMIYIDMKVLHEFFGFYFLLTDYIDDIFAKKFGYGRNKIHPGNV